MIVSLLLRADKYTPRNNKKQQKKDLKSLFFFSHPRLLKG